MACIHLVRRCRIRTPTRFTRKEPISRCCHLPLALQDKPQQFAARIGDRLTGCERSRRTLAQDQHEEQDVQEVGNEAVSDDGSNESRAATI
jgi:hypothetical protein